MSAQVIPFPSWEQTGEIASEADMIDWAIKTMANEYKRYSRKDAVAFGRLLWAKFQQRGMTA